MRTTAVLLLALATVGAAVAAEGPKINVKANAIDLLTADMSFSKTAAERGLEGWLSWLADDAVIFPKRGPIVENLAGIKDHYKATGFTPE